MIVQKLSLEEVASHHDSSVANRAKLHFFLTASESYYETKTSWRPWKHIFITGDVIVIFMYKLKDALSFNDYKPENGINFLLKNCWNVRKNYPLQRIRQFWNQFFASPLQCELLFLKEEVRNSQIYTIITEKMKWTTPYVQTSSG